MNIDKDDFDAFRNEVRTGFAAINVRLDRVETRLDKVEARLDQIEARLDRVEARLDRVEARMNELEQGQSDSAGRIARIEQGLYELHDAINRGQEERKNADIGLKFTLEYVERVDNQGHQLMKRVDSVEERVDRLEGGGGSLVRESAESNDKGSSPAFLELKRKIIALSSQPESFWNTPSAEYGDLFAQELTPEVRTALKKRFIALNGLPENFFDELPIDLKEVLEENGGKFTASVVREAMRRHSARYESARALRKAKWQRSVDAGQKSNPSEPAGASFRDG